MAFVTQDIRASVFLGPHLIWTYLDRSPEPSDAICFVPLGEAILLRVHTGMQSRFPDACLFASQCSCIL